MKKLISGIKAFRQLKLDDYRSKFSHLAREQKPDALMIACSDSRVAPNVFASLDPGDMFVIRNVGNLVPRYNPNQSCSEAAAIEYAISILAVKDIIVCGHSNCGAITRYSQGIQANSNNLVDHWIVKNVESELSSVKPQKDQLQDYTDNLSKLSAHLQLSHLLTYPCVQAATQKGQLKIHAWWFDIGTGDVYAFDELTRSFKVIDDTYIIKDNR